MTVEDDLRYALEDLRGELDDLRERLVRIEADAHDLRRRFTVHTREHGA